MKMIFAVIFLGILMHSFAKECEFTPPADNFNLELYSKIPHFYVTHSKNGPQENLCREHKNIKIQDGILTTQVIGDVRIGGLPHKIVLECTNTPKSGQPGQFSVECIVQGSSDKTKIKLGTSVIATDNKNYAILHACANIGHHVEDDTLVLQTNKNDVDASIKDVFEKMNLSLDKWYSRAKFNCDDIKK